MRFLNRSFSRPAVRWLAALVLMLGTPFAPAPWLTTVGAQATLNQITISADLTVTQTLIPVSSISTIVAGHEMFTDGEAMLVLTTPASGDTAVQVRRGYDGTAATTHAANSLLYTGTPSRFVSRDPLPGSCTPSTVVTGALPVINVRNSTVWSCSASTAGSRWQMINLVPQFEVAPRTVVAGTAYTIVDSDYLVVLSTSLGSQVSVKSFVLPTHVGRAGKVIVIKDESGGLTATTQIVLIGTIDGTNSSLATVVALKTAFQSVSVYAGSGGWFTLNCWIPGTTSVVGCR